MKLKTKGILTLGDIVVAAYRFWGAHDADKMLQLALDRRLVLLCPQGATSARSAKKHLR